MFELPATSPHEDRASMWALQMSLISELENIVGLRDRSKIIYQPIFHSSNPITLNMPDFSGCYAALSSNAANYWPTAAYELAHESVHMLDPIAGMAKVFEEGIAVVFSLTVWSRYRPNQDVTLNSSYARANSLVRSLGTDPLALAAAIRSRVGALHRLDTVLLSELCPDQSMSVIDELTRTFEMAPNNPLDR